MSRLRQMRWPLLLVLCLGALPAVAAAAGEPRAEELPGYLPFAELAILPHQDLTVEINLEGTLLEMIAGASGDDPEFAKVIGALKAIRVRVASLKEGTAPAVRARLEQTASWLDQHGWKTIVRSQDAGEESFIYAREVGGAIVGLTVMTFEPGKEAAVINIVGRLNPAEIGRLGRGLHLPELSMPQRPARAGIPIRDHR